MTIEKGAAQELYRSVYAILHGDTDLNTLLASTPDNPKIYQSFIEFDSAFMLKNDYWITFSVISDRPMDIEQIQDVREVLLDVHVWQRGPGSDVAESLAKRIDELLDNADLTSASLLSWYSHSTGYTKTYEITPELWHVVISYRILCMAQS